MCVNAWRYFEPKASILQISFSERQLYFFHKYTIGFAKFQSTKSLNIQMIDFFPTANYGFACNFFPWLPKNLINLSLLEQLSFMNFQILKYNFMRQDGFANSLRSLVSFFLISCLLDPFMTYHAQLFSDFLQHLRESWKWPLSLINISSSGLIIRKCYSNFFLIEAENWKIDFHLFLIFLF